jgi:hypothetical protein
MLSLGSRGSWLPVPGLGSVLSLTCGDAQTSLKVERPVARIPETRNNFTLYRMREVTYNWFRGKGMYLF